MKEIKIISPLQVVLPRKTKADKVCRLNLNSYRNRQFILNNQIKVAYNDIMAEKVKGLKFKGLIVVTYKLYYSRICDEFNFISVIDKFFLDVLQKNGCIENDDCLHVVHGCLPPEKVKKEDERMEIYITEKLGKN